jgi:hypothetical protein
MRWLDGATVALDADAELALDYAGCGVAPRRGAFGLARPYGAAAPDATPPEAQHGRDGEDGEAAPVVEAPPEGKRRRTKRKRREGDDAAALRAAREDEAQRCVQHTWHACSRAQRCAADAARLVRCLLSLSDDTRWRCRR